MGPVMIWRWRGSLPSEPFQDLVAQFPTRLLGWLMLVIDALVIRVMWRISQKVHWLVLSVILGSNTNEPTADIISTVEFDHTGNYLATGDKGGRVVLFERNETVPISISLSLVQPNTVLTRILPRKKPANISSTPSSSRTNPSSIT